MKILLAPDSFKGTLSSLEVIQHLEEVARRHFAPLDVVRVPIADGGEGTVESLVIAGGGEYREVEVMGPLQQRVKARYGILHGNTAVIEMAQASGLPLVSETDRNPLAATTYGTGELIKAALDEGLRKIIIGIGGSATNDGGIGAAQALGVRFLDKAGQEVGLGGQHLSEIKDISVKDLDPRIQESEITVICDVSNPLTGEEGATSVYGPQKGVTPDIFPILEEGMKNYAERIKECMGLEVDKIPGAGAAGGLGAALVAFLNAALKPGIDTILSLVRFDELLEGVDLVVTGEGRIDGQSVYGKVPVGVSGYCRKRQIPVLAIAGVMGEGAQKVYEKGIDSIMVNVNKSMELSEALSQAEVLLKDAADRMFRMVRVGMVIQRK